MLCTSLLIYRVIMMLILLLCIRKTMVVVLNSVIHHVMVTTRCTMIRVKAPVVLEQIHTIWNCRKRTPLLLIL
ncbi:hypothetical protein E1A91_A04G101300v1 [Gossypium mustelinum]|uniref:Uncharacterized protein n=1 Tax=Gossypium mustelinum TaxID=34275 RepID=A0A5D2ZLS4_GOSMU|nr:hypothetical protein E1A91_A04G101300v1 [Gossypium mustelinum]